MRGFGAGPAETFANAGFALLVSSTMAGALLVLATSIVARKTGLLPSWLALGGFLVAAALLFAIFYLPLFAWLAWVLAVSVVSHLIDATPYQFGTTKRKGNPWSAVNGAPTGGVTTLLSGTSINNAGTISNGNTGTGIVTISGATMHLTRFRKIRLGTLSHDSTCGSDPAACTHRPTPMPTTRP